MRSSVYSPRESGYYPPGAEFDPSSPWNEKDYPTRTIDVYCEQTLSKDVNNVEVEYDDFDESYVDLEGDYKKQHETPLMIINKFKEVLEKNPKLISNQDYWINECKGWIDIETTVDEQ